MQDEIPEVRRRMMIELFTGNITVFSLHKGPAYLPAAKKHWSKVSSKKYQKVIQNSRKVVNEKAETVKKDVNVMEKNSLQQEE